jgi:hypothetical protein
MNLLIRTATVAGVTGRTVFGMLAPFNTPATVSDGGPSYREQFSPGAFTRSIAERGHKIKLLANHDAKAFPIGRAVELEERVDGLHGSFEVARTARGDEALTLIADGLVTGFSVGFSPIRHTRGKDGLVSRTEAGLREVSLTPNPAYESAQVAGVRGLLVPQPSRLELAIRELELLELTRR